MLNDNHAVCIFFSRQLLSSLFACELTSNQSHSHIETIFKLQVFDLLIQRFLEVPEVASQCLEQLLLKYGCLYKFHGENIKVHPLLCMVFSYIIMFL